MRALFGLAALLSTSVIWADDNAQSPSTGEAGGAATTAQAQLVQQARPLHRHPTLFGMLQRNNSIRRRVGLRPHRVSPSLTAAAQDHANYMARTGQFSHYTNGGPQYRANRYGFGGGVRENIAMGTRSIDGAFAMWQNSGAHYASIVSGTSEAGFGYAVGAGGQAYWVGVYGSDGRGETEEQVAQALADEQSAAEKVAADKAAAEKAAAEKLVAEKAAAEKDASVKPVSANLDSEQKPASQVPPAAATQSAEGQ